MSNKKEHHIVPGAEIPPEQPTAPAEGPAPAESLLTELSPEVAELQKQLAEAQSQTAEYKDGWQRALADFQNYKRRVDAEKAETYHMAVSNIIKRFLPVLDDMERALAACPPGLTWAEGIELIYRKLQDILVAEGLQRIQAEGQPFDPNFHEAITQEPAEGVESGHVIAVVRNGYMLGDRVVRPAQVRVAQ